MAEHIAIEQGRHPWLPSEDTELVETFHHYDMPLIGAVRQGSALHLFRCIDGQVDGSRCGPTPASPRRNLRYCVPPDLTTSTC